MGMHPVCSADAPRSSTRRGGLPAAYVAAGGRAINCKRGVQGAMTRVLDGNAVGQTIREDLETGVETLADAGVTPGLATVLMSDDDASETYVRMKHRACADLGIESIHREIDPTDAPETLFDTVSALNEDSAVNGILVQMPVPDHVDKTRVLRSITPEKDVDAFHPENVGRLVAGDARFKPCTPHGVQQLLAAADVDTSGADAVVVGRSDIVGKPMANLLIQKAVGGNATVTVCHSRTADLASKVGQADIVIAAAGVAELIDGSMLKEGAVVVDVGVNRIEDDSERGYTLVGDVEFESAREKASVITPVPGGVGPMTITMLLYNTIKAAGLQAGVDLPALADLADLEVSA